MNLKSIALLVMISLCAYSANAQSFNMSLLSTANYDNDNVAGVATDDTYTYVVQNLFTNPSTPPYTSNSISGNIAVSTSTGSEHATVIVDRIDNATQATTILARIDITTFGSSVTATAVTLYNGNLYIVGYFDGSVKPNGSLPTKTANAIDMFICKVSTTSTGVIAWNQSGGDGEEHATCIFNDLGTLTVGGYYTASGSTSVSSTWPTSTVTTAPGLGATGQRNTFLSRWSSSALACNQAAAWMTLSSAASSAQINGVTTASVAGSTVSYVTGSITGSATTPSLTGVASGAVMFTGRYVHNISPGWGWAVTEGTFYINGGAAPNPVNAGRGIVSAGAFSELYVAGSAAYISGTGPAGYTNGNSDAVLIKYTNITSVTPTRSFAVAMGTGILDVANAVTHDGTHVFVTGNMSSNNYNFGDVGGTTVSYTSSAPSHVFIARYTTSGALDWSKTGDAYSYTSNSTAIATNGKCNVVFGGAFDRRLDWGNPFQIYGAATPNTDHLYVFSIPVQVLKFSPPLPPNMFKPSSVPVTASGATSYSWFPLITMGQTVTITPNNTASVSINLISGGTAGNTFDVVAIGSFTHGGASCTNGIQHRVTQNNKKEDEEEITDIYTPEQSLNTFNLYPNPFSNTVEIDYSFATAELGILQITDMQGRIVSEHVLNSQSDSKTINTDQWSTGMYIAKLIQNNNTVFTKQIVKQ